MYHWNKWGATRSPVVSCYITLKIWKWGANISPGLALISAKAGYHQKPSSGKFHGKMGYHQWRRECSFSLSASIEVWLVSKHTRCPLGEDYSTYWVFVSWGILMLKYVITALLTYFKQYNKLAWGGGNYVKKTVFSCLNKHYWVWSNKYLALFHPNSFTETK